MTTDVDQQRTKRELRLRIGRLRRRIDRRVRSVRTQGQRLASWRTYVERYPGYTLLAALGAGLAASAGLGRGGWPALLGRQLARRTAAKAVDLGWEELKGLWAASAPDKPSTESTGAEDGRS